MTQTTEYVIALNQADAIKQIHRGWSTQEEGTAVLETVRSFSRCPEAWKLFRVVISAYNIEEVC